MRDRAEIENSGELSVLSLPAEGRGTTERSIRRRKRGKKKKMGTEVGLAWGGRCGLL